jgi:TPR repeat protein
MLSFIKFLLYVVVFLASATHLFADATTEKLKFIAQRYYWGTTVNKDLTKALQLYLRAAELGDTEAQYIAGGMYFKGYGTGKDLTKAFSLLYGAAIKGSSSIESQKLLGEFFLTGTGIPRNYREAMKWYLLSAKNGDRESQSELACLFFTGKGGERDFFKAFYWFEKSALQGLATAQYSLGIMYYSGNGVEKVDILKAYAWLSLSAAHGFFDAIIARDYIETIINSEELNTAQTMAMELFQQINSHN